MSGSVGNLMQNINNDNKAKIVLASTKHPLLSEKYDSYYGGEEKDVNTSHQPH
jgi:hypothetical protein